MALLTVLLAGCGGEGNGVTGIEEGTILEGQVVRAGTPVLLSDVTVSMGVRSVQSDDQGEYRFERAPVGNVTVRASHPGYLPYERDLELAEGVNRWDIVLIPDD